MKGVPVSRTVRSPQNLIPSESGRIFRAILAAKPREKRWRPISTAAAILAAAIIFGVSGCGVRASNAFEVSGTVVSNDQVTQMALDCGSVVDAYPWANMSALVSDMIHAQLAREVAAQNDLTFTDEELKLAIQSGKISDQYKAQFQQMLDNDNCTNLALGLTLEQAAKTSMGADEYTAAAGLIDVTINPRFGTWNSETLTVDGSGSLSKADG